MVTIGTDVSSTRAARSLAEAHDGVFFSTGCHPHEADHVRAVLEDVLRELGEHGRSPKCVAVGETGLDYYKNFALPENQKTLFLGHLKLARDLEKPLSIHCRQAHAETINILDREMKAPVRGVVHCFSGTREDARKYLDLGMYLSFAGPITFPNATSLRETARLVPVDRVLVETDAPYLAPQPVRGRRNEPSHVRFTAEAMAELLGVSFEQLCEAIQVNARNLFGIG